MRPTRIDIESFRGYNEPHTFDCLADVVIVCGPNGAGKTSLFDAIAWCLFGVISRLRGSRDVVGTSHIRNTFDPVKEPRVVVHLERDGETASVSRHGSRVLVVDSGDEYEGEAASSWIAERFRPPATQDDWTEKDAERRFSSALLLGQEQISAFLRNTSPRDRFDALATLLGVDLVRGFYGYLGQVENRGSEEIEVAESRLASINQRIEAIRVEHTRLDSGAASGGEPAALEGLLEELQRLAGLGAEHEISLFVPTPDGLTAADVFSAAQELRALLTGAVENARRTMLQLRRIEVEFAAERQRGVRREELISHLAGLQEQVTEAESRSAAILAQLEKQNQRLEELRRGIEIERRSTDAFAAFLLSAEPHVHGPDCPVCQQPIEPAVVVEQLKARAADVPDSLRALERERQKLDEERGKTSAELAHHRAAATSAKEQVSSLEQELGLLDQAATTWEAELRAAGFDSPPDPAELSTRREVGTTRLVALEQLAQHADALLAQARYLVSEDRRSRLAQEEVRLQTDVRGITAELETAQKTRGTIHGIAAAAKASERDIVRGLMEKQKPLLNALYTRLQPHPVLTELDIDFGKFDEKGEVYFQAVAGDTRANVSAIFSTAQLNAVAICIFLGLNLSAQPADFALLDDPIQNMDDFNVLGLLDLLRTVAERRQVIISTHDLQLGDLMRRKLRPLRPGRRTITHWMTEYDERGPRVEKQVDEFEEAPELLPALVA